MAGVDLPAAARRAIAGTIRDVIKGQTKSHVRLDTGDGRRLFVRLPHLDVDDLAPVLRREIVVKFEVDDDEAVISLSSGARLHVHARARDICQVDYRVVAKR